MVRGGGRSSGSSGGSFHHNSGSSGGSRSGGSRSTVYHTTVVNTTTSKPSNTDVHPLLIVFLVLVAFGLVIGGMVAYAEYQKKQKAKNDGVITNDTNTATTTGSVPASQ